ncbi:MAG: hypothetical protein ACPG6V_02925 [Flavobacteriales bacterium]
MNTDFISLYFMGEKDLAQMSFNLFEQDVQANLTTLESYFQNQSCVEYAQLMHKWKPNFKMFGHKSLSLEIQRIETGLKDSLIMLSPNEHKKIVEDITKALNLIKQNIN